jgi:predicted alpha-1,2-mannosidase
VGARWPAGLVCFSLCAVALLASVLSVVVPAPAGATSGRRATHDLTRFVDPFLNVRHPRARPQNPITGTSSNGNTFPGADVPFGMLQWSPDTVSNAPGGYTYTDHRITGFSLTHLSGAGCRIFGDVPFLPTSAQLGRSPANGLGPYDSPFSHATEQAAPGFYGVTLDRWGIGAQLTAAAHAGIAEFTYPANQAANLAISAGGSANGNNGSSVTVVGSNEVTGSATSGNFCGHPGTYAVHFAVLFDHPFVGWSVWNGSTIVRNGHSENGPHTGAFLSFGDHGSPTTVVAKVGISFVSTADALANLSADIPGWSFSDVQAAASSAWNDALNRIQVSGGSDEERDTFYTALYHSLLFPSVFSDANGQYVGMDGRVHVTDGHPQYTNISGWDVYRSQIPLLAILFPQQTSDIVRSLLNDAAQDGGWLPKWPLANTSPGIMDGDSADPIIAEAYAFGARDFSSSDALSRMVDGATHTGTGAGGYVERPGLALYVKRGYVPYSSSPPDLKSSGATTLEYATDDFAIAQLASQLGDDSTWSTFMHRAQNWQRLFNPATRFIQPRLSDGSFGAGFNPSSENGFREGDAWQYRWLGPHNIGNLVAAIGGADATVARLQPFFTTLNGGRTSPVYQGGNEPDLEAPWEYDFTGTPWNTQDVVRRILLTLYSDASDGLPGNDDLGALSSWYVWAAIGLYPEIPGVDGFDIHRGARCRGRRTLRHEPHDRRLPCVGSLAATVGHHGRGDRHIRTLHVGGQRLGKGRGAPLLPHGRGAGHLVHQAQRSGDRFARRIEAGDRRRSERR